MINFWTASIAVIAAFFFPILTSRRRGEGAWLSVPLAFLVFVIFQVVTMETTEQKLSLSDVGYATAGVAGEKTLFVKHPEGQYQTSRKTIIENIEDTTQVEIVLEETEFVFIGPNQTLIVRSK